MSTFTQVYASSSGATYYVYAPSEGGSSYRSCYITQDDAAGTSPTWEQLSVIEGYHAFFPEQAVGDWASLSQSLFAVFLAKARFNVRLGWFDETGQRMLAFIGQTNTGLISQWSGFNLRQLAIRCPLNTVTLSATATGYAISTASTLALVLNRYNDAVTNPLVLSNGLTISVDASDAGALQTTALSMSRAEMDVVWAGLHYYHDHTRPESETRPEGNSYTAYHYRILQATSEISFDLSLDILAPTNADTSYFMLPTNTYDSYWVTDVGQAVQLTLQSAGDARFALVNSPNREQGQGLYALSLQGQFVLQVAAYTDIASANNSHKLLCGLEGTEAVGFTPKSTDYEGDILTFVPNQYAYAPVFPVLKQLATNASSGSASSVQSFLADNPNCDTYTSWVSIERNTGLTGSLSYFAQPRGASLFIPESGWGPFTNVFNAVAGILDDNNTPRVFPMVPYTSSEDNLPDIDLQAFLSNYLPRPRSMPVTTSRPDWSVIKAFELQILNPQRKLSISPPDTTSQSRAISRAAASTQTTTTPQGFLVEVGTDGSGIQYWQSIQLALDTESGDVLQIDNVSPAVQSAFQTNQQFLVVSKEGALGNLSYAPEGATTQNTNMQFDNLISIADWPFQINVGENDFGDFTNVFISKFHSGTLIELVQNPQVWVDSDTFVGSDNTDLLSMWLQNYCAQVIQKVEQEGNDAYQNIYNIIHDANWNGILVLESDIQFAGFPDELKGLLAGIDTTRMKAHHFGVTVNKVDSSTGSIDASAVQSSLFGLIDYVDSGFTSGNEPEPPPNVDYNFLVLTLQVIFDNSAITNFTSKIQLAVNSLFADTVVDSDGGSYNTILLDGTYQNEDGVDTYVFMSQEDTQFYLNNMLLTTVEALKVQFQTLIPEDSEGMSHSRFSFVGNLVFETLEYFDAFAFDALRFSNLGINMIAEADNGSNVSFEFDATQVAFDVSNSIARTNSLARNFPMALTSLVVGSGQSAKDMGFLSMKNPFDDLQDVSKPGDDWFALSYNLNLGTLGALATKVGLVATLMVQWGASKKAEDETSYANMFIKLPGTGNSGKTFSLQNVIKLSIKDIELAMDPSAGEQEEGADASSIAFMLKLSDMSLKFLGIGFPPNGDTMVYIFGNPDGSNGLVASTDSSSFGWYAAYVNPKKSDSSSSSSPTTT